jgi:hypothetical protein
MLQNKIFIRDFVIIYISHRNLFYIFAPKFVSKFTDKEDIGEV